MMTAQDLTDLLEDLDPDTEIRLAHQPAWPLECSLRPEVVAGDEDGIVYLAEQEQIGYLSGQVTDELGWGR